MLSSTFKITDKRKFVELLIQENMDVMKTAFVKEIFWTLVLVLITLKYTEGQVASGPICFSCDKTNNPEDCRHSETCSLDQVCSVQEITAPHGIFYFWSGCENINVCAELSYTGSENTIVGKRQASLSSSRCVYCCNGDMCNKNCTSFVNLALHKPAYQSSIGWSGSPKLAVDGNTDSAYAHGSCMHTAAEHYSWWTVDLGNEYRITKVKIYERSDPVFDAFRNFHLTVLVSSYNATLLDKDSALFTKCGYYLGHSNDGNIIIVNCPKNIIGRWVRVQQSDPNIEYIQICEVEVFGY